MQNDAGHLSTFANPAKPGFTNQDKPMINTINKPNDAENDKLMSVHHGVFIINVHCFLLFIEMCCMFPYELKSLYFIPRKLTALSFTTF